MVCSWIQVSVLSLAACAAAAARLTLEARDCNGNGVPDQLDLAPRCSFSAPASYACGPDPWSICAGDLDGDADIDFLVRDRASQEVCVLLNHGDGTFAAARDVPEGAGGDCSSLDAVADLDGDGDLDFALLDPEAESLSVFLCEEVMGPPESQDENADGIPDECEALFIRGDCNGDGRVMGSVTDAVFWLTYIFLGGHRPPCRAACDANGDGPVASSALDAVFLLNHNFLGGPPLPAPFPECGLGTARDFALGCKTPPPYCEAGG